MDDGRLFVVFHGLVAALVSMFGYFGAAGFSAAVLLTLVSVPLAILCGVYGARKSAAVAIYFGVTAWLPHWSSVGSTFRFGEAWFLLFGLGLLLAFVMVCWQIILWKRQLISHVKKGAAQG